MPFNVAMLVAIAGVALALAVWFRTRRIGPVVGVVFTAFVVMAIADPSLLSRGGQMVGRAFDWVFSTIATF